MASRERGKDSLGGGGGPIGRGSDSLGGGSAALGRGNDPLGGSSAPLGCSFNLIPWAAAVPPLGCSSDSLLRGLAILTLRGGARPKKNPRL